MVCLPTVPFSPTAGSHCIDDGVRTVGHAGAASVIEFSTLHMIENRADCAAVQEADNALRFSLFRVFKKLCEAALYSPGELFTVFPAETGKV